MQARSLARHCREQGFQVAAWEVRNEPDIGELGNLRAIAGEGDGYKHLIVWRYEDDGPDEVEVRLDLTGARGRSSRIVQLDAAAPVNNIKVIHFGRSDDLGTVPLTLGPWDVRWIEIE